MEKPQAGVSMPVNFPIILSYLPPPATEPPKPSMETSKMVPV